MPYEFWIGARYAGLARARRRGAKSDRFISFIAASSMAGIALGVAALIIVMSVMNGFQRDVRDRMLSVLPHVELYVPGQQPAQVLEGWENIASLAADNSSVQGAAPFVAAQAMLARGRALNGVQVRGIDPSLEPQVSEVAQQMTQGELTSLARGSFSIVLGRELAAGLHAKVGDTVMVLAPQGSVTPAGFTPRMRQFTVSGLFSSGHYEYDSTLAFMHVNDAAARLASVLAGVDG